MITKVTITPKLNTVEWVRKNVAKDWFHVQNEIDKLGLRLHVYMVNYILTRRKRRPGTGNLAGSITYEPVRAPAVIGFRIGNMNTLQSKAPYWYVLNYGKKVTGERFIPGGGKYRPVMFGNSPADASLKGRGTQRATQFAPVGGRKSIPTAIRPINYIQSTIFKLKVEWRKILPKRI